MARKQGNARWKSVAGGLIVAAVAFGTAGCKSWFPEHVKAPVVERRDATGAQLLAILNNQAPLRRLSAHATVSVILESEVVPATKYWAIQKERGKPYGKKFLEFEVSGSFFLTCGANGPRNVRMSGLVEGASDISFTLLGKDNECWMLIPMTREERDRVTRAGGAALQEKLLHGTVDPNGIRPAGRYRLRPQDFASLLLLTEIQEFNNGEAICAIEKWPDYYVLSFLRAGAAWPNHLYSKIWIEREQLTVAIHQLFDVNGELIAEARFRGYSQFPIAADNGIKVEVPTEVEFLWPKDKIVMRAKFDGVKVNDFTDFKDAKVFDVKQYERYPTESLDVPAPGG